MFKLRKNHEERQQNHYLNGIGIHQKKKVKVQEDNFEIMKE